MKCSVCGMHFHNAAWTVEGNYYTIHTEIVFPEIMEAILKHAVAHRFKEIEVDCYAAEYASCEGCQLASLRFRHKWDELLEKLPYELTLYMTF